MLKLGQITLDMPFFQAPLSGYSDGAMCRLSRKFGAPLTFAGVALAKSVIHPAVRKKLINSPDSYARPVGAQILGSEAKVMAAAAAELEKIGYDIIDLNFACPVPKVLRRGRGGFLMQKPDIVKQIYQQVRGEVKCPVMIKLRAGFDSNRESKDNLMQICADADDAAVDAVTIHGRTVTQRYSKKADWSVVADIKKKFPRLTVIGSGDLLSGQAAFDAFNASGVDGVLIARGAIGNPWIFKELRALFEGRTAITPPTVAEQGAIMLEHFEMVSRARPAGKAVGYFRKFAASYCKRHPQRKHAQADLMAATTTAQVIGAIEKWY